MLVRGMYLRNSSITQTKKQKIPWSKSGGSCPIGQKVGGAVPLSVNHAPIKQPHIINTMRNENRLRR
jgi:hypothetical protein